MKIKIDDIWINLKQQLNVSYLVKNNLWYKRSISIEKIFFISENQQNQNF
jgi:hypothetical protein